MINLTGRTSVLGIIGHPIEHSLSPLMQNAALQAAELDYIYVPFAVRPEGLADAVRGLRELGVVGFNVTIPHKEAIVPLLDRLEGDAARVGAVNTVKREGDELVGYNTDGTGFVKSLAADLSFDPSGAAVVLLGAGGAARGGACSLAAAGASKIVIINRSPERGERLATDLRQLFPAVAISAVSPADPETCAAVTGCDLLVNTTSIGMKNVGSHQLDLSSLNPVTAVYDMVYVPSETGFLKAARERGCRTANGLGMLAGQGEEAFRIWTGVNPPAGLMRKMLDEVAPKW